MIEEKYVREYRGYYYTIKSIPGLMSWYGWLEKESNVIHTAETYIDLRIKLETKIDLLRLDHDIKTS